MTDKFIFADPKNKSFVENTEQIDVDLIEWNDYNYNICSQCGQDHSYKLTAGITIFDMIPFLNIDKSREV